MRTQGKRYISVKHDTCWQRVNAWLTFTFMLLADAFIQSDLQCIQPIHLYCHYGLHTWVTLVCVRVVSITARFSLLQLSHHLRYGAENVSPIFISFHITLINTTRRVPFFLKVSMITNVMFFIQQLNKQEVNIKRLVLDTKKNPYTATALFSVSEQHEWFVPEWFNQPFKWIGSVAMNQSTV